MEITSTSAKELENAIASMKTTVNFIEGNKAAGKEPEKLLVEIGKLTKAIRKEIQES